MFLMGLNREQKHVNARRDGGLVLRSPSLQLIIY